MSDLKVVIYNENRTPRSFGLSRRVLYRTLIFLCLFSLLLVASVGVAVRFYLMARLGHHGNTQSTGLDPQTVGPTNSAEDKIKSLEDEVQALQTKLTNLKTVQSTTKEIDKRPVLGLFSPIVVDRTPNQDLVHIKGFRFQKGNAKTPTTLTFELHNSHPDQNTQKGYITVLARSETELYSYPNVFQTNSPYLLDFEKGETFQVARFRLVNAQFDVDPAKVPNVYQILIFNRDGELLINTLYEAN